jgi:hypothetical protein
VGKADLGVRDNLAGSPYAALLELEWCKDPASLIESLWDAFKLAVDQR